MRILFISRWFPFPPNNGSKLRISQLLRALATRHTVTLISFIEPGEVDPGWTSEQTGCKKIIRVVRKPFEPDSLRARLGFFSLTPRSVIDTYSDAMRQSIAQELSVAEYQLVIASQFDMAVYAASFQGKPSLFEEVELGVYHSRYIQASGLARLRHGLTWFKHARYLRELLQYFGACSVVSSKEQELVQTLAERNFPVQILPNYLDLSSYANVAAQPVRNTLIYTGSFSYFANFEAMEWFVSAVFPKILEVVPTARLLITGDPAGKTLPACPNVFQLGFVEDVRQQIASAWISLAPLQQGGGTRLKILEAMALNTPVVATTKGAEGLGATSGEQLLIADSPDDYAQAVISLLHDPAERQRVAHSAADWLRAHYSAEVVVPKFLNLVDSLAAAAPIAAV